MSARRFVAAAAACGAFAAWGGDARAADESGVLQSRHHSYESPQHFALELRIARYVPQIDDDPSLHGAHPYGDVFGTTPRIEVAAELDWQLLRIPHVGTLGPGLSVGYTTMGAKANILATGQPSAEDTNLSIFPFYGVAVFRFDALFRDLNIPIAPYAKGGLGFALWRASNTLGTSVAPDGSVGKGHTWGTHVAFGAALALDVFDRSAARNLDQSIGINHTYLFGEYMMSDLNGLGQQHALYVGTRNVAFGLAFEF